MTSEKAFHLQIIKDEFRRRTLHNPHYSLRSFARDLSLTPSWVSDFLSGKKGLSPKTAGRLVQILSLSASEARQFMLSVQACHARSGKDREAAQKDLQSFRKSSAYKMKPRDFILLNSWYHQAILELTEVEGFSHTELEVAERLRLPLSTVKRALADLQTAQLLSIEHGKMKATFEETESTVETPSVAIKKYHEQILQKGILALHEQAVQQREYSSTVFAFDATKITEAKRALRKFQKEFTRQFYLHGTPKNSVYQLSIQFFKLDHSKGKTS